jgi:hypothetical protein
MAPWVEAFAIAASNKREVRHGETIVREIREQKRKGPSLNLQAENRAAQLRSSWERVKIKLTTRTTNQIYPFSGYPIRVSGAATRLIYSCRRDPGNS